MKLAYFEEVAGERFAVYPHIKKRRAAGKNNPEEPVRMRAYNDLIERLGYPVDQIVIEYPVIIREDEKPRFADIVVFDDKNHKRPYIVVEAKEPNKATGEKQGQRYATILRAVYCVWTNGIDRSSTVLVNRYPEEAAPLAEVPSYGGSPKFAIDKLLEFTEDKQVTKVFKKCHDLIWSLNNLKPDAAFTEFLKLLLVKLADEKKDRDYDFQVLLRGEPPSPEDENETAQRIRLLFKQAVELESEYSAVFKDSSEIGLSNDCIAQVVKVLQRFTLSDTPVDLKGRAFETFLSGDLRKELKEFMTPRPVIKAIIQMASPDVSASILDPCCGSGGFLIEALRYVRTMVFERKTSEHKKVKAVFDFAHDHLYGFDDSEQMAAVARINMLINEDGRAHVFKQNSLVRKSEAPYAAKDRLFDFIFTNPPFGKKIAPPSVLLNNLEITKDENGKVRKKEFATEILFLERNLEWLKPGGLMFIVLPDSVLGNATFNEERRFIEKLATIRAVISLPADTFGPSGAKSKTSVIAFERLAEGEELEPQREVFLADVKDVGYDFTGRSTKRNDLPELVSDFLAWKSAKPIVDSKISKITTLAQMGGDWLAQKRINKIADSTNDVKLDSLCSSIRAGKTAARAAYKNSGLHMVKVGNLTGAGIAWNSVERQYVDLDYAERFPTSVLKKGDLLFTAAAHGPKWIGLKVDIFDSVPLGFNKTVVCCAEIMICTPKIEEGVDPYELLLFLRSNAGYQAIQDCIRGQSGHIYSDQVREIRVPKLKGKALAELQRARQSLIESLKAQRRSSTALTLAINTANRVFPSSTQKPIIA